MRLKDGKISLIAAAILASCMISPAFATTTTEWIPSNISEDPCRDGTLCAEFVLSTGYDETTLTQCCIYPADIGSSEVSACIGPVPLDPERVDRDQPLE